MTIRRCRSGRRVAGDCGRTIRRRIVYGPQSGHEDGDEIAGCGRSGSRYGTYRASQLRSAVHQDGTLSGALLVGGEGPGIDVCYQQVDGNRLSSIANHKQLMTAISSRSLAASPIGSTAFTCVSLA